MTETYSIAKQFTREPVHRYIARGPNSGELFRETVLVPMFRAGKRVVIDMGGTSGYSSGFLEEAFGGLVRAEKITAAQFWAVFDIKFYNLVLLEHINRYVDAAAEWVSRENDKGGTTMTDEMPEVIRDALADLGDRWEWDKEAFTVNSFGDTTAVLAVTNKREQNFTSAIAQFDELACQWRCHAVMDYYDDYQDRHVHIGVGATAREAIERMVANLTGGGNHLLGIASYIGGRIQKEPTP